MWLSMSIFLAPILGFMSYSESKNLISLLSHHAAGLEARLSLPWGQPLWWQGTLSAGEMTPCPDPPSLSQDWCISGLCCADSWISFLSSLAAVALLKSPASFWCVLTSGSVCLSLLSLFRIFSAWAFSVRFSTRRLTCQVQQALPPGASPEPTCRWRVFSLSEEIWGQQTIFFKWRNLGI